MWHRNTKMDKKTNWNVVKMMKLMVIEGYSNNDIIQDNIIIVRIKQWFRIVIVSHMIIVLHKIHI